MTLFNPALALFLAFFYSLLLSFTYFEFYYILPTLFLLFTQRAVVKEVFKKALFLNLFIIVLVVVLLFEGESKEAINLFIRTNMIILFNLFIFYHSKGYDIVRGLSILKFPRSVVSSTYFTIKMIETLNSDIKNIKTTLNARGFRANTSLFTYQTFGNLLGLLLVKSIRKSQALKNSFTLRGFSGDIYLNEDYKISRRDYTLLLFVSSIFFIKVVHELLF